MNHQGEQQVNTKESENHLEVSEGMNLTSKADTTTPSHRVQSKNKLVVGNIFSKLYCTCMNSTLVGHQSPCPPLAGEDPGIAW
jgi:hypothetical protein